MKSKDLSNTWLFVILVAGCAPSAGAQTIDFIRQFGTLENDAASALAHYGGSVYVGGCTSGAFPGKANAGYGDAFLRKYSYAGVHQWTRQFGNTSNQDDCIRGVAVNSNAVYVAGNADGPLPGFTSRGAFVRKYDLHGILLWTVQFDSSVEANGLALLANGVYVAGNIPTARSSNGILIKLNPAGRIQWTRTFGVPLQSRVYSVGAGPSGIYITGTTTGAFPGQTSGGGSDAFIVKYDKSGEQVWVRQFGSEGREQAHGVAVSAGSVYVVGDTDWVLPGQTGHGLYNYDAWVRKYDDSGTTVWTHQFGTPQFDFARGVAVDADAVYIAGGSYIFGSRYEAVVSKYSADGVPSWTMTLGSPMDDATLAINVARDRVYAVGNTGAALPGQTPVGYTDVFLVKLASEGATLR
jgi:hypothetical protein